MDRERKLRFRSGSGICAADFSDTDPSGPIGPAAVLPGIRGKVSPCPIIVQQQPQMCTGYCSSASLVCADR